VTTKSSDDVKHEQIKIFISPRPGKESLNETTEIKCCLVRNMEERKKEYDRARARIFSSLSSSSLDSVHTMSRAPLEGKNMCFSGDNSEALGENLSSRDSGTPSRVTIFRDSQKDRIDLDYDQSCET
ncbi:unnamed protein product, partial [Ilex paraguariensis]